MHILVLHQYFLGQNDPGGSRFNQLCKYWAQNGHDVTVLAGTVHHGTGRVDPKCVGRWMTEEKLPDGVRVLRCYVPSVYRRGYAGRFCGYVAFLVSSLIIAATHVYRPNILVASSPPLTIGLGAILIAWIKRIPFVFEIRDLWPEFAIEMGILKNPALIRVAFAMEAFIYRNAERINVLTPAFKEHLLAKKGVSEKKLIHIPNGADMDILSPGTRDNWVRRDYGWEDRFVVMYVGAHSKANHLWQLLDVAQSLRDYPDILMVFVGDGNEREQLLAEARNRELENIEMIGPQPKNKIGDFINAADVGIAVLKKTDGFKTVYPNKVFDYMGCAKPIVVGIDGEARRLVEESCAGIYAEPENTQSFLHAILKLYRDRRLCSEFGMNGYEYVRQNFSRQTLAIKYEKALKEVLAIPVAEEFQGRKNEPTCV